MVNTENKEKINEDYLLNENDIINFGNCIFEVIKKRVPKIANEAQNGDQFYNISSLNNKYGLLFKIKNYDNQEVSGQNKNKKLTCQICGKDSNDNENPLFKICKCNNHFKCLRKKLISDIIKKNNNFKIKRVYIFNSLDFKCSDCQEIVPLRFEKLGKIYNFLEFEDMFYIVLEYLGKIDDGEKNNENDKKQKSTKVYIINLDDKSEIKIGRNSKSIFNDINLQEDHISRKLAVIKFNENGNLILENRYIIEKIYNKEDGEFIQKEKIGNMNEEKIGKLVFPNTFVLIKDNFKLKENKINFKVRNCYITAKLNLKKDKKQLIYSYNPLILKNIINHI